MKITWLSAVPVCVSSLAVTSQSATAANLMHAVGHRNVTTMEALVQELADESVNEPGWKFDEDIQGALKIIRDQFVKNIQDTTKDQHKVDQEHMNCFTEECFGGCVTAYKNQNDICNNKEEQCHAFGQQHDDCRADVYSKYIMMAQACGNLHCFDVADPLCEAEDCLCPDLENCHKKGDAAACEAQLGECKGMYGSWLQTMITKYTNAYAEWNDLHAICKQTYHEFLTLDMQCDSTQKEFEECLCDKNDCHDKACNIDYDQCEAQCWAQYQEKVKETECLERDRKIDWSATKKIECYIDVLLHDYTKDELLSKCGTNDCINTAREEDYKHCSTICPQIDHEGHWPQVHNVNPVQVGGHPKREFADEFHLGDHEFQCDTNGDAVFTKHRGGAALREGEARCTEHLDIDYQVPQCMPCDDPPPPVCDAQFHKDWYTKFDDVSRITEINDCCQDCSTSCFPDQTLDSSFDGETTEKITVSEHSKVWAYNRCECTECAGGTPVYPGRPEGRQCGMGAHTISPDNTHQQLVHEHVCIEAKGDMFAAIPITNDLCIQRMTLTHKEGFVSCRKKESGNSNWGCDAQSMGLVLADGDNRVNAPVWDTTMGLTPGYSKHAQWYKLDGVSKDSKKMAWTFNDPFLFRSGEYKLWYSEDLSGGTENDNRGRACYDLAMETAETCDFLAPLQFGHVKIKAKGDKKHTVTLPEDTCVTEIAIHWVKGHVSCYGGNTADEASGGESNFGCGHDHLGLVWTKTGEKDVIMPHDNVEGFSKVTGQNHAHAHWYKMDGVGKKKSNLVHEDQGRPPAHEGIRFH